MATAFTAAIDDLFIGKHGAQFCAPVHGLRTQIRQAESIEIDLPLTLCARTPALGNAGSGAIRSGDCVAGGTVRACHCDFSIFLGNRCFKLSDRSRGFHLRVKPCVVCQEPNPLRPLVILGIDRRKFARPVVHESKALQLAPKIIDGFLGGDLGMHACLNGVLLRRQTERVPAHGMQNIEALHLLETTDDVGGGVALGVPNMEPRAGWVREHVQAIELRARRIESWLARVRLSIPAPRRLGLLKPRLPAFFGGIGERRRVSEGRLVRAAR